MADDGAFTNAAVRTYAPFPGAMPCEFAAVVGFDIVAPPALVVTGHAWQVLDFAVRLGMHPFVITRTGVDAVPALLAQLHRWDLSCAGVQRDGRHLAFPAPASQGNCRHSPARLQEPAYHHLNAQLARVSLLSVRAGRLYLTGDLLENETSGRAVLALLHSSPARVVLDVSGNATALDPGRLRAFAGRVETLIMTEEQWETWMCAQPDAVSGNPLQVLVLCPHQWLSITSEGIQAFPLHVTVGVKTDMPLQTWRAWHVAVWLLAQARNWSRAQAALRVGELAREIL